MNCEIKPISQGEAYRTLRELFLRMDVGAKKASECETFSETADAFKWALAMDRLLDALDAIKPELQK